MTYFQNLESQINIFPLILIGILSILILSIKNGEGRGGRVGEGGLLNWKNKHEKLVSEWGEDLELPGVSKKYKVEVCF